MDAAAALPADADSPAPGPQAGEPLLGRQLERLGRLADLGLEIAEGLAAQAKGTGPQVVEGDLALAYDRVARAVRMAVMLQSRLVEDARLRRGKAAAAAPGAGPVDPAGSRKDQISRIVKRIAQADHRLDGYQVSWAAREARERLEHDDIYGQVMSQPVSDIVDRICCDLGLAPDWARLADEAWAQDEIDSGEVGEALQELVDGAASPACGRGGPRSGGEGMDQSPALVSIPTFEERLQALAQDPEILAAARRESG